MKFILSIRSKLALRGVHPHLVEIVKLAGEMLREARPDYDFTVTCGLRTKREQIENIRRGVSWTMRSRHLTGHAVDLAVLINGKLVWDWPAYHILAKFMFAAADKLGYPLEWGGDWAPPRADGPHFQLPRNKYP